MNFKLIEPPLKHSDRSSDPTIIVLHATDGTGVQGSIDTLREKGLGYHYIIDRNGVIFVGSGLSSGSWKPMLAHAGNSYGPNEEKAGVSRRQDSQSKFTAGCSVNHYSIGISFANYETKREPLTKAQIDTAIELVKLLKSKCPSIKWITTHAIVSPGRKTDPAMLDLDKFWDDLNLADVRVWRYTGRK